MCCSYVRIPLVYREKPAEEKTKKNAPRTFSLITEIQLFLFHNESLQTEEARGHVRLQGGRQALFEKGRQINRDRKRTHCIRGRLESGRFGVRVVFNLDVWYPSRFLSGRFYILNVFNLNVWYPGRLVTWTFLIWTFGILVVLNLDVCILDVFNLDVWCTRRF